jgi:hypothetical protein
MASVRSAALLNRIGSVILAEKFKSPKVALRDEAGCVTTNRPLP